MSNTISALLSGNPVAKNAFRDYLSTIETGPLTDGLKEIYQAKGNPSPAAMSFEPEGHIVSVIEEELNSRF